MPSGLAPLDLPAELDTTAFRAAWADWLAYRRERRLAAYKPVGLARCLARLAAMGHDAAVAALDHSMAQNYQGIWSPPPQRGAPAREDRAVAAMRYARET